MQSILTERLLLREWKETDYKDLYEYAGLVGPNAGWKPHKDEKESKILFKCLLQVKIHMR